jgi:hypothetical protein
VAAAAAAAAAAERRTGIRGETTVLSGSGVRRVSADWRE